MSQITAQEEIMRISILTRMRLITKTATAATTIVEVIIAQDTIGIIIMSHPKITIEVVSIAITITTNPHK